MEVGEKERQRIRMCPDRTSLPSVFPEQGLRWSPFLSFSVVEDCTVDFSREAWDLRLGAVEGPVRRKNS